MKIHCLGSLWACFCCYQLLLPPAQGVLFSHELDTFIRAHALWNSICGKLQMAQLKMFSFR